MFSDIFNLLPTSRVFFVSFCFWFCECSVFAFSSSRIGQVELWRVNPSQRADRAPPLATQQIYRVSGLLGWGWGGQQRQMSTGFILVAPLQSWRQLSLLHTSSPSFQGVITQPSKYQNMLWFETWCTESQGPEWLWFTSKFKKILSCVGYLFTVFKYVGRVF